MDTASVASSCASAMACKFSQFLKSKKVLKAETRNDIRACMNASLREEEEQFWAYVKRKAIRKQKADSELSVVEKLSLEPKIIEPDGLAAIDEDVTYYNDPTYITDISEDRFTSVNRMFATMLGIKKSPTEKSIETVSVRTGQSALTDTTLVGRVYKPLETEKVCLQEMMMNTHQLPPAAIYDGLPLCFQPHHGDPVNPYGFTWQDARYNDMCAHIRDIVDNTVRHVEMIMNDKTATEALKESRIINEKARCNMMTSRAIAICIWYINKFKVYLKKTHEVLQMIYNQETGIVDGVYASWDFKCEMEEDGLVGRLPDQKKSTDTMMYLWKQHDGRPRVYDEVFRIAPARKGPLYSAPGITTQWFNTFCGFAVDRAFDLEIYPVKYSHDRFDIRPITEHIEQKYFEGDAKLIRWFKRWLYEILWLKQRTGVAVVMFGDQGVGKTMIVDNLIGQRIIGQIAGDSRCVYKKVDNMEGFGGQFNSSFQDKILINLDEVQNARKHDCQLKAMITNTINDSEQKYKDRTTKTNYTNLWITSNEERAFLKITSDDRRYFVKRVNRWWTSGKPAHVKKYFDDLNACIESPRAIAEFMLWVKEAEAYDIDVRNIPVTDDKLNFITENVDLTWRWVNEMIEHRRDVLVQGKVMEQQVFVDMYNDKYGDRYRATPQMFTKMFKTLGFELVGRNPLKVRVPSHEHIMNVMKSLNKWIDM